MKIAILGLILAPILCRAQKIETDRPQRRYAFVIGNSAYAALPVLPAAVKEAEAMKLALEGADFAVTLVPNATWPDIKTKYWDEFVSQLQPGDVVFFYYSGHAVQGADDDDYLLPVDFGSDGDLKSSLRVARIIEDIVERKVSLKFLMLEGSRSLGMEIQGAAGLGLIVPDLRDSGQALFAMSAQPGQLVTTPGADEISPFTQAVVDRLSRPGLTPAQVFEQAGQEVLLKTDQRQTPLVNSVRVTDDFYFHPPVIKTEKPEPAPPVVIVQAVPTNTKDRQEYVHIAAGSFKMGCVPSDQKCEADEKPQHEVTISKGFWMGRNEVTVNAYQRFIDDSKKQFKMPGSPNYNRGWRSTDYPMVLITWDQAKAFCTWAGGRLPTEAEWEYAARSGRADEIYPLNDENSRDKANFYGTHGNDRYEEAAPVHSFDANGFNLYDMAGNVWEWAEDWHSPAFGEGLPAVDPHGPSTGKEHVIRGGSFESRWQDDLRISVRKPQAGSSYKVGFRCVLEENEPVKKLLNIK